MRPTFRQRVLTAVTIALAAVGLLAGCAGGTATDGSHASGEVAVPQQEGGAAPQQEGDSAAPRSDTGGAPSSTAGTSVEDRAVVTTTSMSLKSEDPPATVTSLEGLVASKGGYFESREESGTVRPSASLVIRIPADKHDGFISEVKPLAEVTSISTSEEDVTLVQLDLDARISTLESSVAALQGMLAKATDTTTMLDIEATLTDRQAELQSLRMQRDALADDIAMSTVFVNITTPDIEDAPDDERAPGFLAGLEHGWNAFLDFLAFTATMLGFLLPLLIILGILTIVIVLLVRRRLRARREQRGSDELPPLPEPRPEPQPEPAPVPAGASTVAPTPAPTAETGDADGKSAGHEEESGPQQ